MKEPGFQHKSIEIFETFSFAIDGNTFLFWRQFASEYCPLNEGALFKMQPEFFSCHYQRAY